MALNFMKTIKDQKVSKEYRRHRAMVRAVNSYPPAYPGCHGLRLKSIGLRLGCPQSHYV